MELKDYVDGMSLLKGPDLEEMVSTHGHTIVREKFTIVGNKRLAHRWSIPQDFTSIILIDGNSTVDGSAYVLVYDPLRTEVKKVEVTTSGRTEEEIREELTQGGYQNIYMQFPEHPMNPKYHLVGVRARVSSKIM